MIYNGKGKLLSGKKEVKGSYVGREEKQRVVTMDEGVDKG